MFFERFIFHDGEFDKQLDTTRDHGESKKTQQSDDFYEVAIIGGATRAAIDCLKEQINEGFVKQGDIPSSSLLPPEVIQDIINKYSIRSA